MENQRGCRMAPCNCKSWYSEDAGISILWQDCSILRWNERHSVFRARTIYTSLGRWHNLKGEMSNIWEATHGNNQQSEAGKFMYLSCWPTAVGCSRGMTRTRCHSWSTAKSSRVPLTGRGVPFQPPPGNGCSWNYLARFCKQDVDIYWSWTIIQIIPRTPEF